MICSNWSIIMALLLLIFCLIQAGPGLGVQADTAMATLTMATLEHVQKMIALPSGSKYESTFPISARRMMLQSTHIPGEVQPILTTLYSTSRALTSISPPTVHTVAEDTSPKDTEHNYGLLIGLAIALPILAGAIVILAFACCIWEFCLRKPHVPDTFLPAGAPAGDQESLSSQFSRTLSKMDKVTTWIKSSFSSNSFSSKCKTRVWLSSACEMEYSMLQAATDNFSYARILGEGGSGRVYKAKLDDDAFAAVKVLGSNGRQAFNEFQSEVDLMRQVRHPNLVSLLGFCNQGQHRLLVYELMQNGSLEDQLYGPSHGAGLSWNLRLKIALESARGLEYLHEHCNPPVVHRDFKASNILLDSNFNAKISDFGLATPLEGLTRAESLKLIGTIGYVAPEFFESGTLTEKSDVYAFGVTLLELLTGRKPVDHSLPPQEQSLVTWAKPQLTDRQRLPLLVDQHIRTNLNLKHLYQVAAVAALCVQSEPSYRPLIPDVVQSLVPLVPVELGGALRTESAHQRKSGSSSSIDSFGSPKTPGPDDHLP